MAAVAEMTRQAVLAVPPVAGRSEQRLFDPAEVTLEDSILEVWEDLSRTGRSGCPVCGGSLRAAGGCAGCGSELT
ncbi:MAG TPA: hypothetical protein VK919_13740 [Solirubrobacterales bacterium]|nr:hypothetical protein [Solirubrobacterales bacterium]